MTDWEVRHSVDEPHDPLTHLADVAALAAILDSGFTDDHRIVVIVSTDDATGMTYQGYYAEDPEEAACDAAFDLIQNLRALLQAHGRDVQIHRMPGRG